MFLIKVSDVPQSNSLQRFDAQAASSTSSSETQFVKHSGRSVWLICEDGRKSVECLMCPPIILNVRV